jgi:hypothetical protein
MKRLFVIIRENIRRMPEVLPEYRSEKPQKKCGRKALEPEEKKARAEAKEQHTAQSAAAQTVLRKRAQAALSRVPRQAALVQIEDAISSLEPGQYHYPRARDRSCAQVRSATRHANRHSEGTSYSVKVLTRNGTYIQPVFASNHWFVCISPGNGVIEVYDSAWSIIAGNTRATLLNKIKTQYRDVMIDVKMDDCEQQGKSPDCGLFVVNYVGKRLQSTFQTYTRATLKAKLVQRKGDIQEERTAELAGVSQYARNSLTPAKCLIPHPYVRHPKERDSSVPLTRIQKCPPITSVPKGNQLVLSHQIS